MTLLSAPSMQSHTMSQVSDLTGHCCSELRDIVAHTYIRLLSGLRLKCMSNVSIHAPATSASTSSTIMCLRNVSSSNEDQLTSYRGSARRSLYGLIVCSMHIRIPGRRPPPTGPDVPASGGTGPGRGDEFSWRSANSPIARSDASRRATGFGPAALPAEGRGNAEVAGQENGQARLEEQQPGAVYAEVHKRSRLSGADLDAA